MLTAREFHTQFVSASIIYQSGSTQFGDTSDDIHSFTGRIHLVNSGSVSGSSTSTGSFGRVEGRTDFTTIDIDDDEIPIAKLASDSVSYGGITVTLGASDATPAFDLSDATAYTGDSSLVTTGTVTSGIWNSTFGSTANTIISGSANAANISGSLGTNATLIRSLTAANISGSFEGGGSTKISGSSTSTGSFGRVETDNLTVGGSQGSDGEVLTSTGTGVAWEAGASFDASAVDENIIPDADNSRDLGTASKRWRFIYTTDLKLSNEGLGGNEVDGTEGSWTIQEGEDNLYLLNGKSGKIYKMTMEEVGEMNMIPLGDKP
jgi:hypothetical protein